LGRQYKSGSRFCRTSIGVSRAGGAGLCGRPALSAQKTDIRAYEYQYTGMEIGYAVQAYVRPLVMYPRNAVPPRVDQSIATKHYRQWFRTVKAQPSLNCYLVCGIGYVERGSNLPIGIDVVAYARVTISSE
jgi:hypothetical protein